MLPLPCMTICDVEVHFIAKVENWRPKKGICMQLYQVNQKNLLFAHCIIVDTTSETWAENYVYFGEIVPCIFYPLYEVVLTAVCVCYVMDVIPLLHTVNYLFIRM